MTDGDLSAIMIIDNFPFWVNVCTELPDLETALNERLGTETRENSSNKVLN